MKAEEIAARCSLFEQGQCPIAEIVEHRDALLAVSQDDIGNMTFGEIEAAIRQRDALLGRSLPCPYCWGALVWSEGRGTHCDCDGWGECHDDTLREQRDALLAVAREGCQDPCAGCSRIVGGHLERMERDAKRNMQSTRPRSTRREVSHEQASTGTDYSENAAR